MQATDEAGDGGRQRKRRVLFLCTGNACRSQMAEGWARALMSDRVDACSAGTSPHGVNRLAIRAMAEAGVDIAGQRSKHVGELLGEPIDLVVTVCGNAAENCPVFPGRAKVVHVGFEDPPKLAAAAGAATDDEAMPHYRRVRDEIKKFIEAFDERIAAAAR
ncbi:MAG TPA: arsenate reductase ArsC [Humisphaera sp.]